MEKIKKNDILEPRDKMMGGALWVWEDPILDHKYIMGVDVSRGDSEDFTTFNIVDIDTTEQVVEFLHTVPPEIAAEIAKAEAFAKMYANPLYRIPITFTEILPVGILVSLISSLLLRNSRFMPARAA